jgi:DNA-binding transcriptional regulator YiaG
MPNITTVLNDQIRRLARREIKNNTLVMRRAASQYRREIAALKRQIAELSKSVASLQKAAPAQQLEQPAVDAQSLRFRADGLRTHRAKLGISAQHYGQLVGVTGQTIYDWESGKSRPRTSQLPRIASVRGLGKREALKRLAGDGNQTAGAVRSPARVAGRQTAQEFILALVKSGKATSTADITNAWQSAGRAGRPNNTLTLLVQKGRLKRVGTPGRGSRYQA